MLIKVSGKMYNEIVQVKSLEEIEEILFKHTDDFYFIDKEIKSVEYKNTLKSLGARYLIKKSILEFLKLGDDYHDIEIENEETGKPVVKYSGTVEKAIKNNDLRQIHVSISHSKKYVTTLVIIE